MDKENKISQLISNEISSISRQAGSLIMDFYKKEQLAIKQKPDATPVTEADLASHQYICNALSKLSFKASIISEEDDHNQSKEKLTEEYIWLIDPLDGTRGFINQTDEFAVSIGLLRNLKPVAGVIFLPVTGDTYYGSIDAGAFKRTAYGKTNQINCHSGENASIIINQSYKLTAEEQKKFKVQRMAAAGKFGIIAEGSCGMYFRNGPTSEWDTAAGHAIALAAGANLLQLDGKEFLYGKENFINPPFVVFNPRNSDWQQQLSCLIKKKD